MSCRDKTYVIFDGDGDRWARVRMMSWQTAAGKPFNFFQAHDLLPLSNRVPAEVLKAQVWQRLSEARQVLVLSGESTRTCRFALMEIDLAQTMRLPIVVVNLNGLREMDPIRCPEILQEWPALHVEFTPKIVEAALEQFPAEYASLDPFGAGARHYSADVDRNLKSSPPLFGWLKQQTPTSRG